MCIAIDWEGEHLQGVNDLRVMRKRFATHVPITHFICPSTSVGPSVSALSRLCTTIHYADEVGLHIHPFRELIKPAGDIKFRYEPNYHNRYQSIGFLPDFPLRFIERQFVSGRGVPLSANSPGEINTITGTPHPVPSNSFRGRANRSFRAGGG